MTHRSITHRSGVTFQVMDTDTGAGWDFWGEFAAGRWEPDTLNVMAELLGPEDTFVDIGAWIGPLSLWARQFCNLVVAVEPDPTAAGVLRTNMGLNRGSNYITRETAVGAESGPRLLRRHTRWGDSMSRLAPPDDQRGTVEDDAETWVSTTVFADVAGGAGYVGMVKIDVEGAEGEIVAHAGEHIRDLDCPVILAAHYPWMTGPDAVAVEEFMTRYTVARLNQSPDDFPTYLLTP